MHPAPSIIAFTVASGLGYGLVFFLGLGLLDPASLSAKVAHVLAFLLIAGGLMSSTLHLGNPQRAWRALSQWRTSWLSREGVLAILAFLPLSCITLATLWSDRYIPLAGLLASLLAVATVYATSMIYASLKAVDAWSTRLTPACYLLFSGAGGGVLATAFAATGGGNHRLLAAIALVLLGAAWLVKLRWRARLAEAAPLSTPETATGLGALGRVRLLERPHTGDNYLTREMVFRIGRKHADKLFALAIGLGGLAPVLLLSLVLVLSSGGWLAVACTILAVIFHVTGMLAERWLFFAEARHAVSNYYGG